LTHVLPHLYDPAEMACLCVTSRAMRVRGIDVTIVFFGGNPFFSADHGTTNPCAVPPSSEPPRSGGSRGERRGRASRRCGEPPLRGGARERVGSLDLDARPAPWSSPPDAHPEARQSRPGSGTTPTLARRASRSSEPTRSRAPWSSPPDAHPEARQSRHGSGTTPRMCPQARCEGLHGV